MARYTIREFTEVVGLGKDRDSVIRAGIILKALCGIGMAKETGTRRQGNGRPAAVYEVQDPIVIPLSGTQKPATVSEVAEAVAPALPVQEPVAVAPAGGFCYDDDEED